MNTKEKAQYLASFYDKLAENNNGFIHPNSNFANGPCIGLTTQELLKYEVNPPKPKKKIIDLSMMVGTDIDMEFSNDGQEHHFKRNIEKLLNITPTKGIPFYSTVLNDEFYKCRIRQDHPHANIWDECPLPEGLTIIVAYKDVIGESFPITDYALITWPMVSHFKVLGTAENAIYEWQKEK